MVKKDDKQIKLFEKIEKFTKGYLSADIRTSSLQAGNDAYEDIVDNFKEIVGLVHSEGGWIVYGLGKIGLINDVSLLVNDIKEPGDNKVLSQEISTHVVHIYLSKKDYTNLSPTHGRSLDNLKFDFSTL